MTPLLPQKIGSVSLSVTYPIGPNSTKNWQFLWETARRRKSGLLQNLFYRKLGNDPTWIIQGSVSISKSIPISANKQLPAISFGKFLVEINLKFCRENFGRYDVIILSQSATFILHIMA